MKWVLILLAVDLLVLGLGLALQTRYLRHLRHHHRPQWEIMRRRAPRSWRYFRGMPTTGFLIASYFHQPEYRQAEEKSYLTLGRWVLCFNLLHPLLILAILVLAAWHFLQ